MSDDIKFEKAMERLEKLVGELEVGNIPLEDALKKYEEGVKLSRICQQKLDQAEKKIEILTRTLEGSFKKEPFEVAQEGKENSEEVMRKKGNRKAGVKTEGEDEDLLIDVKHIGVTISSEVLINDISFEIIEIETGPSSTAGF